MSTTADEKSGDAAAQQGDVRPIPWWWDALIAVLLGALTAIGVLVNAGTLGGPWHSVVNMPSLLVMTVLVIDIVVTRHYLGAVPRVTDRQWVVWAVTMIALFALMTLFGVWVPSSVVWPASAAFVVLLTVGVFLLSRWYHRVSYDQVRRGRLRRPTATSPHDVDGPPLAH